jgi:SAM-dependent methyltransferase
MSPEWLVELAAAEVQEPGSVAEGPVAESLQELTSNLARDANSWNATTSAAVVARFDERAETWATRDTPDLRFPLLDALQRGGIVRGGRCLEVGSGTGIQTPALLAHFDDVVALDLSYEMLRRTPAGLGSRVRADAAALPLAPGSVDAVVCVNAFLFAEQYLEVLRPDGVVLFASTRAERTPIYLPPTEVLQAIRAHDASFVGTTARAWNGCWTVARRAGR